jgi:anti-sigma factor RsiW
MSELVTDYLDGTLPASVRLKARLHLFLCVACRHYFDQMRQTVRFLTGAPRQAPPASVEQQILDSIAAHPHGDEG